MAIPLHSPVLFFDGVCNLCNSAVQFIIKRDSGKRFRFASLQSKAGEDAKLKLQLLSGSVPDSIILYHDGKCYVKSDAALRTLFLLGGIYKVAVVLYIIPRLIRDKIYDLIARKRYAWYGRREKCMIPSAEITSWFID